jgi:hypothetical protein
MITHMQEFMRWWAWYPVKIDTGRWVWMQWVWRSVPDGREYQDYWR